jgi:hypothetical protein
LAAEAEDLVLVSVDPAPARFNSSTVTLLPAGQVVYSVRAK